MHNCAEDAKTWSGQYSLPVLELYSRSQPNPFPLHASLALPCRLAWLPPTPPHPTPPTIHTLADSPPLPPSLDPGPRPATAGLPSSTRVATTHTCGEKLSFFRRTLDPSYRFCRFRRRQLPLKVAAKSAEGDTQAGTAPPPPPSCSKPVAVAEYREGGGGALSRSSPESETYELVCDTDSDGSLARSGTFPSLSLRIGLRLRGIEVWTDISTLEASKKYLKG